MNGLHSKIYVYASTPIINGILVSSYATQEPF